MTWTKYTPRGECCTTANCLSPVHAKNLCNLHYRAARRPAEQVNPCGCGCGGLTQYRFLHGHHTRLFTAEEQARRGSSPNNGASKRDKGTADCYRKVDNRHEHRTVAEHGLGRPLNKDEIVHHKNGNKKDKWEQGLGFHGRREILHGLISAAHRAA